MPKFVKNPKFIIGAIVTLWAAYVVWANFQLEPVKVRLLPFDVTLDFRVSAVIIGAVIFGSAVTLIVQWLWRRRSSKNASESAAASAASTKTVA